MKIVISYTPDETLELAQQLRDAILTVDDVAVWMDESEDDALERVHRTQDAIVECDLLVLLVTKDINRTSLPPSLSMMDLMYAQQHGKTIVPVKVIETRLPKEIADLPLHDLTQNRSAGIRKLVADIRERTGQGNTATIRLEKTREQLKDFLNSEE